MLLNSQQILEFLEKSEFSELAQVGIDLSLREVTHIIGGHIGVNGKEIKKYEDVLNWSGQGEGWNLKPGVYSLTFCEGIKLDSEHTGFIYPKSSLLRCGGFIATGVFDPGFECKNIGATLFLFNTITIEKYASIAQFIIHENYKTVLYNGNYQGERDLK